ncbi:MAG: hypothetical protein KAW45_00120 [Thermoplasmatales archaeon]|nr:hypothetical protein [Thermoplasmatales archaeon]
MKKNEYVREKEVKKYKGKIIGKIFAISIAFIVVGSCLALYLSMNGLETNNLEDYEITTITSLSPLPIVSGIDGNTFLEDEAGISAYTNVEGEINLGLAKTAFRTIEYETNEYIIGSIPLPDYSETEDVHCYVHKDGWVVSYYLKEEPAAKIVDWENYGTDEQITGTKLEQSIVVVCDAAGVIKGEVQYYDYRYPNANKLMIVAEALWESTETDTFDIILPDDFVFYERSYSHCNRYTSSSSYSRMYIDEEEISRIYGSETNYDLLSPSKLSPDVSHSIKTTSYHCYNEMGVFSAIVLVYQET